MTVILFEVKTERESGSFSDGNQKNIQRILDAMKFPVTSQGRKTPPEVNWQGYVFVNISSSIWNLGFSLFKDQLIQPVIFIVVNLNHMSIPVSFNDPMMARKDN